GAFAEELGVRHDGSAMAGAGLGEDALDRPPGADWHGRLGDDELRPVHVAGDRARDVLDVAEVGGAVGLRRRADGDEDGPAGANGLGEVGGEAKPPLGHVAADDGVEAGLVDGDRALIQRRDLALVDVTADDVVSEVGQTSAGHQADVARSDYGNVHEGTSRGELQARDAITRAHDGIQTYNSMNHANRPAG